MYVPSFNFFSQRLNVSREALESNENVTIPAGSLRFLLQLAVAVGEFDQENYLENNPDLSAAVKAGRLDDVRLHYIRHGFFEGRKGATPRVDEGWYREQYPDVAKAIDQGAITSASLHFLTSGEVEGRVPQEAFLTDISEWKRSFKDA
ncbi:hypothetical protein ACNHKD_07650 [Methylocystis sp. JAN1]|uniref:hypothetical protein n=1 Tax=Methylocystis sp. JAN1 TaxID=3397211 RepID=UPI003FA31179